VVQRWCYVQSDMVRSCFEPDAVGFVQMIPSVHASDDRDVREVCGQRKRIACKHVLKRRAGKRGGDKIVVTNRQGRVEGGGDVVEVQDGDEQQKIKKRVRSWLQIRDLIEDEIRSGYDNHGEFGRAMRDQLRVLLEVERPALSLSTRNQDGAEDMAALALSMGERAGFGALLRRLEQYGRANNEQRERALSSLNAALLTRAPFLRKYVSDERKQRVSQRSKLQRKHHEQARLKSRPNPAAFAVPDAVLFSHKRFRELPPLHRSLSLAKPGSLYTLSSSQRRDLLTQVPQSSSVWRAARRRAVYTASNAAAALGFYERATVAKLRAHLSRDDIAVIVSAARVGHREALLAWQHARQPARGSGAIGANENVAFAMEWGSRHENQALWCVLEQIPSIRLGQVGIVSLLGARSALGSTSMHDGDEEEELKMPDVAASPDALWVSKTGEYPVGVVEIKSRCPWIRVGSGAEARWVQRNGVQPHRNLQADHYVQLQIQMACCEVTHALLASHAVDPNDGSERMRVFHVQRCDSWLSLAGQTLRYAYNDFVCNGVPPPADFYHNSDDALSSARERTYNALLEQTSANLARVEIAHEHNTPHATWPDEPNDDPSLRAHSKLLEMLHEDLK